jgi:hypothetical protein
MHYNHSIARILGLSFWITSWLIRKFLFATRERAAQSHAPYWTAVLMQTYAADGRGFQPDLGVLGCHEVWFGKGLAFPNGCVHGLEFYRWVGIDYILVVTKIMKG